MAQVLCDDAYYAGREPSPLARSSSARVKFWVDKARVVVAAYEGGKEQGAGDMTGPTSTADGTTPTTCGADGLHLAWAAAQRGTDPDLWQQMSYRTKCGAVADALGDWATVTSPSPGPP